MRQGEARQGKTKGKKDEIEETERMKEDKTNRTRRDEASQEAEDAIGIFIFSAYPAKNRKEAGGDRQTDR